MAGLDDIVQNITIEGGDEAAAALQHIGETGAAAFSQIIEAAAQGDFSGLATLVGGELAGAFDKAAESVIEFVHAQSEAVEMAANLSSAVGASFSQFQGLGEAFASVGISTQGFDRSMGRLAQTVASSWSEIQQQSRTAADEVERSSTQQQQSALNVAKANEALAESYDKVHQTAVHDSQGIADAQVNLQKALLNQQKDQGVDTSAAEKVLKTQEDINAVAKARQAIEDANTKAANDEAKATTDIQQAQLNLKKAKEAQVEGDEKAYEASLKNLPEIAAQLNAVAAGTTKWGDGMKLADVKAQDLAHSVILAASVGGKQPEAIDVFMKLAGVFKNMGDSADEMNTKMEIVQKTMGAGFRAGQASASQLIAILDKGPEALKAFSDAADKSGFKLDPAQIESLKDFNAAWAELGATIQRAEEKIAAFAAPALTQIFNAIRDAIEAAGVKLQQFGQWLDKTFGGGTSAEVQKWGTYIAVIGTAAVAAGVAIGAIILVVGAVGTAFVGAVAAVGSFIAAYAGIAIVAAAVGSVVGATIGTIIAKWGDFKSAAGDAINGVVGFFDNLMQKIKDIIAAVSGGLLSALQAVKSLFGGGSSSGQQGAAPQGAATGGHIRGPGTGTSDTAGLYALSDGEYVIKSAAVQNYGVDFFHAINNMALGAMAMGGHVGTPVRMAAGGPVSAPHTLNLTIDGQHFNGLKAPESVASKLKSYAVGRQTSSTGRSPSWRQ